MCRVTSWASRPWGLLWLVLISLDPSSATHHTNQCIQKLGGILSCSRQVLSFNGGGQTTGTSNTANNNVNSLGACCDGVRELIVELCDCNPMINTLLGTQGQLLYKLAPVCRIMQPLKWRSVPLRLASSKRCEVTQTFDYGCAPLTDNQIDANRFASIANFGVLFEGLNDTNCFDTNAFVQGIEKSFRTDNSSVYVPYGIGSFTGFVHMAEYLAIAFRSMNHDYWWYGPPDPTKKARLEVSPDGLTWYTGNTNSGSFLRGLDPYQDNYATNYWVFQGCEAKAEAFHVYANEDLRFLVELFVQGAQLSQRWGIIDICKYHTQFCAADEKTRQYQSEQECLDYMHALPVWTLACGQNRPFAGLSLPCKFKHHFMVPSHPELHCAHIGKGGVVDIEGHYKCDDVAECSADEGQDEWPPLQKIMGADIPVERRALFNQSNIGYESEPVACAIPYNATATK